MCEPLHPSKIQDRLRICNGDLLLYKALFTNAVLPPILFPSHQTLLDLGASPDYKDSRGLTPLYHSSMVGGDPYCCELLLHDHAQVGCVDENGWQEIHQVAFSYL